MKKLLVVVAAAGFIIGCASDRYAGGTYDTYDYTMNPDLSPDYSSDVMQTNGPGMHLPTVTGLIGPGTAGPSSGWTGAPIP